MLAAIRPDSWNLPLLVHLAGAALTVGALAVAAVTLIGAANAGPAEVAARRRFGFRTLLLGVVPSFLVMRISAEWLASEEDVDEEAAWLGIGYTVTDLGLLILIAATICAGLAARNARRDPDSPASRLGSVAAGLTVPLLAAYAIAIWAMTAKPD